MGALTAPGIGRLTGLRAAVSRAIQAALRAAGAVAIAHVKARAPFLARSGAHSARFTTQAAVGRIPGGWRLRLTAPARHATYLEFGTRPHMIYPRRADFLRFEVGGRVVYARKVRHPGTKATRYLSRARDAAAAALGPDLGRRLAAVGRSL